MTNVEVKNINVKTIQKYLLLLIDFIHKICIENNIKYSLDCGSLIGAVREKGFIEWDDDADIILKRDEYEKLIKILKSIDLPDNIGIYYPEEKEHFFDFNVRIYYKKERIRNDEESIKLYDGIYSYATLDLFVLDSIPENIILNRLYVLKLQIIFGLAMSKRHDIKFKKYGIIEKIAISILSIIGKAFSIRELCKLYNNAATSYNKKCEKKVYCISWSPEYPGYQFEKILFDEYILTAFCDREYYIVKNFDKVLRIEYGDDYLIPKKTHDHENYSSNL